MDKVGFFPSLFPPLWVEGECSPFHLNHLLKTFFYLQASHFYKQICKVTWHHDWKISIQLTYWHSRMPPVWRCLQTQEEILPDAILMRNKKSIQGLVSLRQRDWCMMVSFWNGHFKAEMAKIGDVSHFIGAIQKIKFTVTDNNLTFATNNLLWSWNETYEPESKLLTLFCSTSYQFV